MKRRDRIKDLYSVTPPEKLATANSEAEGPTRSLAGPVRSMGLALDRMESESQALKEALAAGTSVIEIEPGLIDGSFVRDRLPEETSDFTDFQRSIAENGQEVPILLRPHPDQLGRFQIAFGHRRHRACAALEIKVRAIVRELSDRDLILAQGLENAQRKDLSYIERSLYAARLEDRGFAREPVICDALATDKGELSKMISVARAIPEAVINAIGPAPKAGRRRWLGLAEALEAGGAKKLVLQAVKDPDLAQADSDTRFLRVFAAAASPRSKPEKQTVWTGGAGRAATLTRSGKTVSLSFDSVEPEFAEFIAAQLDQLYASFRAKA